MVCVIIDWVDICVLLHLMEEAAVGGRGYLKFFPFLCVSVLLVVVNVSTCGSTMFYAMTVVCCCFTSTSRFALRRASLNLFLII